MIASLKGLARQWPWLYLMLRRLRYARRDELDSRTARLVERLCGGEPRVLSGPFSGMRYVHASGSGLLPKLVGCYELEIQAAVLESLERDYSTILDIGAGEGYYAVGYALRLPRVVVHAFDTDPLARERLRALAALNDVSARISIRERCTTATLQALLRPRSLVFSDCEGGEKELLDPERVPALHDADLLVEMHDFLDPSISRWLLARLSASHEVRLYRAGAQRDFGWHPLADLPPADRDFATWEGRPAGMEWAWMRARSW